MPSSSLLLRPLNVSLKTTRRTGRLTPAASVDVAGDAGDGAGLERRDDELLLGRGVVAVAEGDAYAQRGAQRRVGRGQGVDAGDDLCAGRGEREQEEREKEEGPQQRQWGKGELEFSMAAAPATSAPAACAASASRGLVPQKIRVEPPGIGGRVPHQDGDAVRVSVVGGKGRKRRV